MALFLVYFLVDLQSITNGACGQIIDFYQMK